MVCLNILQCSSHQSFLLLDAVFTCMLVTAACWAQAVKPQLARAPGGQPASLELLPPSSVCCGGAG